jgi:hypothetical protein
MGDRRAYTGTKTLQTAWTVLAALALAGAVILAPESRRLVAIGGVGGGWLLGLVLLGWRERRAWNRLVANSTFERQSAGSMADLQRIVKGHSIAVQTDVPGLLSQTHLVLAATVEGVDASVDIELERRGEGASEAGVTTGNPALDAAWVVRGSEGNVEALLSADVQSALMEVDVPARIRVRAERVDVRVPFTRLKPAELATLATVTATIVERLERLGRGEASPVT